jgi:hypothetical protein
MTIDLNQLWDQYPYVPLIAFMFICYLIGRKLKQREVATDTPAYSSEPSYTASSSYAPAQGGLLSLVLFYWSKYDPFHIGDLLRSIFICGASGSGKSSGSLYVIAKAIAKCSKIGGLILSSKPEDRQFWQKIFHQAGRLEDLIIFHPQNRWRFNFIDFIRKLGGSARDVTEALMVIGETLEQGDGGNREPFWREQTRRMLHHAVEIVLRAMGRVTAPDIQRFITEAALTPAALNTPEFKNSFHYKCLKAAHQNCKTEIEKHDFGQAFQYWKDEYPNLADRTRSSITAGAFGILAVFNTGIVRELISSTTNISPAVMDEGKWILVDMPISSYSTAGAFILSGFKYLTQRYILARHANEDTSAIVITCDEYQKVANSFDPPFLAECRGHRGSMLCATQSIHSLYTRIREAGEHGADALLTNFYHKVFHALGDDKTAAYASSLIGRRLKTRVNVSSGGEDNAHDALYGTPKVTASTSQSIENIVENREFMQGLRTGGRVHGYMVDGIVVRSEAFSTGENYLRCSFSQR